LASGEHKVYAERDHGGYGAVLRCGRCGI